MKKVLLISNAEICHQPRLIKAGDFLFSKGYEITVLNPVTGLADKKIYEHFKESRKWKIIENKIDKKGTKAYFRWFYSSMINKIARFFFKIKFPLLKIYFANKGLIGVWVKEEPDIIIINLVDNLPYACRLKKRFPNVKLVYDSQEFFKGQFPKEKDKLFNEWIDWAERKFIPRCHVVIGTTNAMCKVLQEEYKLKHGNILRVRNVPYFQSYNYNHLFTEKPLQCIWHGFKIYLNNERGVGVLIKAIARCNFPISLTIQGRIDEKEKKLIVNEIKDLKIEDKIILRGPANPDQIVESIIGFDIGLQGEVAQNLNQLLTSSNKLFESLAAGAMVIGPDMPGIAETIHEYQVGLTYNPGDPVDLAKKLTYIHLNRHSLEGYRKNALEAYRSNMNWEQDYNNVYLKLQN